MTTPNEPTTIPAADGADGASPVWTRPLPEAESAEPSAVPARPVAERATARSGQARRAGSVSALLVIGVIVASLGIGFAAGRATSTGQTGTSGTTQTGGGNPAGLGAGLGPGGFDPGALGIDVGMTGTVVSVAADSITIKLADGQTTTLSTSATTTYHEQNSTTATAVAAGQTVSVKVSGLGAGANGPNAAASPGAAAGAQTATDVTITSK